MARRLSRSFLFFFNDTATTEIYTLSLHDALPILLLGHGDAQHAQITKLAPQVHGELVVAVDLAGTRCNLGLCELAHGIAQRVDVLAQLEVQARQVGKAHLVSPVEIW